MQSESKEYREAQKRIKELETEVEALKERIKWMENSRFWKLRNFSFTALSRLTGKKIEPGLFFKNSALAGLLLRFLRKENQNVYKIWKQQKALTDADVGFYRTDIETFKVRPEISIVIPYTHSSPDLLQSSVNSLFNQIYPYWKLYIAAPVYLKAEQGYIEKINNDKLNWISISNQISLGGLLNQSLQHLNSGFVIFLNNGDLLSSDALYAFAKVIENDRLIDFVYSDEDQVNEKGEYSRPYFKPDWCPDNLVSRNYIGNSAVIKVEKIKEINGFAEDCEGSEFYDLNLRLSEISKNISHIPKILYSKRALKIKQLIEFQHDAEVLDKTLKRRGETGEVVKVAPGYYNVIYRHSGEPLVSVIIPCKNKTSLTAACLNSIFRKSTYKNFEIVLVDNGSSEKEFAEMSAKFELDQPGRFKCLRHDIPFNFSKLVNFGVHNSNGEYIILLNNDTEVITPEWIERMLGQAQRKSSGVVGVKLLYSNNTIQHAGVIVGLGLNAGHPFTGSGRTEKVYDYYTQVTSNFSALTGACLMVKKDVYLKAGGFEENLAVDFNDIDFCLKLKNAGLKNIYVPYVELYHYESISRGNSFKDSQTSARFLKESQLFKDKWIEYIKKDPCYNINLSKKKYNFAIEIN
jgi:O-antigen biosynthesis protein